MTLNLTSCKGEDDVAPARRMTADEFHAGLKAIGYGQRQFAAFSGANPRTVQRWADGEQDIPAWVNVMLYLMEAVLAFADDVTLPPKAVRAQRDRRDARKAAGITDLRDQYIHHVDGDPTNNRAENLLVTDKDGNPVDQG